MKFITKNKILILIGIVIVIMLGIFLSKINFKHFQYVYVKNYQDIINKVGYNMYDIENKNSFQINDVKDLSETFKTAYTFIDPSYFSDNLDTSTLSDNDIIHLTYLIMTGGIKDVCIEKNYFSKMAQLYFGKDKLNWKETYKSDESDFLNHGYCFAKEDNNILKLEVDSLIEEDNQYLIVYKEDISEEEKEVEGIEAKFWNMTFLKTSGAPRLSNITISYDYLENDEDYMYNDIDE